MTKKKKSYTVRIRHPDAEDDEAGTRWRQLTVKQLADWRWTTALERAEQGDLRELVRARAAVPGIRPFVDPEAESGSPAATNKKRSTTKKKAARRATLRTRSLPRSHLVRLDKKRCERAAGVTFGTRAWAQLEWLAEYCVLYADPSVEGQRAPPFMMADWKPQQRKQRADILPMLVREVAEVFHASGGNGRALLTRLLRSLFTQAGVKLPATRTLRNAVTTAITTGLPTGS